MPLGPGNMTLYNVCFSVYTLLVSHKEKIQYMRQCTLQTVGSLQRMAITCHTIHFIESCLPNDFEPVFFCWALYTAKHFIEGRLPFKKEIFAAARAFYRRTVAAEHFIESWGASSKALYRAELLANHFIKDGHEPVQFIQRVGLPEMTWSSHFISCRM